MSFLESLSKFLFGTKKQIRHIDLDPESIKTHNTIRALANENASLKGELARLMADLGELRESEKDLDEEDEVKIELNNQKKELQKKTYPKYFSLGAFFRKLIYNKKFREKIGYYSFDGSEKIAKVGDIGFSGKGIILLDDKQRVISYGEKLQDIFWSVPGLGTDVSAFKIPLCLDEDGGYVENPMVWEASELIPTQDGRFKYSKARKKPFYEYIKQLMAEISEKQRYIEEVEIALTKVQEENDDLKIAQRVAEDSSETSRAELGQSELSVSAIGRIFRSTERELSQMRDTNIILEDNVDKLEKQVKILRDEAEKSGITPSFQDAIEKIDLIKSTLKQQFQQIPMVQPFPKEEGESRKVTIQK